MLIREDNVSMDRLVKRIKKNRIIAFASISSIAAGLVIIFIGMTFYKNSISKIGIAEAIDYRTYQYHYAIISKEADAPFWEAIYQGALDQGKEQNVYVEKIGSNLSVSYSLKDLMLMAIAAKVDGIIIEPDDEEDMIELINMADEEGIPVITVLKDAPLSKRKSFIGINSYNQGQIYGKQVLEVLGAGKQKVTVLFNSDAMEASQNIIYSSIREMVDNENVEVKTATVNTQSAFSPAEDIRNIIMDTQNPPDVLVCLSAVDTKNAYQAVVDYNKVGDIDIIGYYEEDLILKAIEKDIIHSTMTIDAKQLGAICVEALTEFKETNQVSDYLTVDISVINGENVKRYIKEIESEKEVIK
ncbi:substrate-binding domain-containing protein [Mobilitalea sibirica]|uniref:Substrate-binding domain-containing protein n=1 Tax=Mobilitalea sibirica TaxID=1462919 RepID=A0A8J7H516_9FIRM|nr:substrate-binding domain-containing protein [Mobilitalea sibirica]MBH1942242.1 substrate-binding domain-containing protein [Mobilitalea sibirica]